MLKELFTPQIIHNATNTIRRKALFTGLSEQGIIDFNLVPAEMLADPITGCSNSHKKIILWALANKLRSVVIFEDDIEFTCKRSWECFKNTFSHCPDDFDIYLGGSYHLQDLVPVYPGIVMLHKFSGTHCMVINHTIYDHILKCPAGIPIDVWICKHPGKFYLCYPMPAIQSVGYSDIIKGPVDYSDRVPEKVLYRG